MQAKNLNTHVILCWLHDKYPHGEPITIENFVLETIILVIKTNDVFT